MRSRRVEKFKSRDRKKKRQRFNTARRSRNQKRMTHTSEGIATDDNILARRTTNLGIGSTEGSQGRAGPWGVWRPDAAFPSFVIPFYDGSLGERISGRRQKSGSQAEGTPKRKSPTKVGAHFSTSNILLDRLCIPQ